MMANEQRRLHYINKTLTGKSDIFSSLIVRVEGGIEGSVSCLLTRYGVETLASKLPERTGIEGEGGIGSGDGGATVLRLLVCL